MRQDRIRIRHRLQDGHDRRLPDLLHGQPRGAGGGRRGLRRPAEPAGHGELPAAAVRHRDRRQYDRRRRRAGWRRGQEAGEPCLELRHAEPALARLHHQARRGLRARHRAWPHHPGDRDGRYALFLHRLCDLAQEPRLDLPRSCVGGRGCGPVDQYRSGQARRADDAGIQLFLRQGQDGPVHARLLLPVEYRRGALRRQPLGARARQSDPGRDGPLHDGGLRVLCQRGRLARGQDLYRRQGRQRADHP